MFICKNCKAQYNEKVNFCKECGSCVIVDANADATPQMETASAKDVSHPASVDSAYTRETPFNSPNEPDMAKEFQPVQNGCEVIPVSKPENSDPVNAVCNIPKKGGGKISAIMGMAFGILGLILSFYYIMYAAVFANTVYYYGEFEEIVIALIIMAIFFLPPTIVGLALSCKPVSKLRGMALAGKITSIISLGVWALSFFIVLSLFV